MFLRYTLPPGSLWDWFEPYMDDEEEIDVKAGGGKSMTIGEMCRLMLTRLEWFDTRFPRIAVNVEKYIRSQLEERAASQRHYQGMANQQAQFQREEPKAVEVERDKRDKGGFSVRRERSRSRSDDRRHSRDRSRDRKRSEKRKSRSRSRERPKKSHKRSRSKDRHRSKSRDRYRHKDRRDRDYSEELRRFKDDSSKHKKHSRRSRSRSR